MEVFDCQHLVGWGSLNCFYMKTIIPYYIMRNLEFMKKQDLVIRFPLEEVKF